MSDTKQTIKQTIDEAWLNDQRTSKNWSALTSEARGH